MNLERGKYHFVGVGGIGMCGLAELLHNMGARVTGSDLTANANTKHLESLGVNVSIGHSEKNLLTDVDVLVYSSAIAPNNPEVRSAVSRRIPIIPRAEALAELMRLKRGLAVAGTHGKTTTTSMVAAIFLAAKLEPTIVIGGRLDLIQSTAKLGKGEWLVAEADESDGSFSKLFPEISIITNIDNDHLDHFNSIENIEKAFRSFGEQIPFFGSLICCGDDPRVRKVFEGFPKRIFFYGFGEGNDYQIIQKSKENHLCFRGQKLGLFSVGVPGRHNTLNAAAAIAAGMQAGISFAQCQKGLMDFQGVDRRFHFKGLAGGVAVYDDYGHHPTEVAATLQAFKEKFPDRRLVVFFQPHRYSRTVQCWQQFLGCFTLADKLVLTDIYPAGENSIEGVDGSKLLEEVTAVDKMFLAKKDWSAEKIVSQLKTGDIFVTLGAGDGWKLGLDVLAKLKETN
jgi:UDP-N-acetylmuramate--alanine ligase